MGWINSFLLHAQKGLSQQEKRLTSHIPVPRESRFTIAGILSQVVCLQSQILLHPKV
jgi:hypothetical protein